METLVLLARESPLPRDVDLEKLLGKLGPQAMPDELAVAWFEDGEVVRDEPERAPNLGKSQASSNPLLRTQGLLRQRLRGLFAYSRAVSFANRGGP
jgi:hypothetical protein